MTVRSLSTLHKQLHGSCFNEGQQITHISQYCRTSTLRGVLHELTLTFTQIDDRSLEFSVYMCPNDLKMFIMSPSCAFNMQCICLPWRNLFTFCSSVKFFFFISSWWIPMRCKHKPPFISNWRNSMPHFIEYNFFLLYKNN